MLQIKPALFEIGLIREHPETELARSAPPRVALELTRLHRGIVCALADGTGLVQFTGAGPGVGTTRILSTLAEIVGREGHRLGSLDLSAPDATIRSPLPVGRQLDAIAAYHAVAEDGSYDQPFELVLLDTAPISVSARSLEIVGHVGGTVVIAEAGRTTEQQIRTTFRLIEEGGGRLLGLVLNRRGRLLFSGRRG